MRDCLVSVHVSGMLHSGHRTDIDQMAADFVEHLKAKGHTVSRATVTSGEQDLLNPTSRWPVAGEGR